jgi:hypothetical protein
MTAMDTTTPATQIEPSTPDQAAELESHVQRKLWGWVREFQLEIAEEGIILRGRAQTFYAKQLAQQAIMEATRVPILANYIEVD